MKNFKKGATAYVLAFTLLTFGLAGCSEPQTPETNDVYPKVIQHAFGETLISERPERVFPYGWGGAEAMLSLGETPVALNAQYYGANSDGVLPWVEAELIAQGIGDLPVIEDVDSAPDYERIADLNPDLIFSPYSGLTDAQYTRLSEIAPVVAYPETPWATGWQEILRIAGAVFAKEEAASERLAQIQREVATIASNYPEFEGVSTIHLWQVGEIIYVYRESDPRVQFAESLGFTSAAGVESSRFGESSSFFFTLEPSQLDLLDSDLLIVYASNEEELDAFLQRPEARAMEQVRSGSVAKIVGPSLIAAVSPPTALSLTWGIDEYVKALSRALD